MVSVYGSQLIPRRIHTVSMDTEYELLPLKVISRPFRLGCELFGICLARTQILIYEMESFLFVEIGYFDGQFPLNFRSKNDTRRTRSQMDSLSFPSFDIKLLKRFKYEQFCNSWGERLLRFQ